MEIRHLKYFVKVAEEENITRAASRLHLSQPALSRKIRDLEQELDIQLFDRDAKSLKLTPAGRVFLEESRLVLSQLDQAIQAVRSFAGRQKSEIHIGFAPTLTANILPGALRAFQDACTYMQVQLHDLTTEEMALGVRNNSLQIALGAEPASSLCTGLVFEKINNYRPAVAIPLTHPMRNAKTINLKSFVGERLLAYSSHGYPEYHLWLRKIFRKLKPSPQIIAEYDSYTSLITAVESGKGLAIVHQGFEYLKENRFLLKPIIGVRAESISFGLLYPKKGLTLETKKFIEAVRKQSTKNDS